MRALLDINVLLALTDEDHIFHDAAHDWYARNRDASWASCPLTENGMTRVMSNLNYNPKSQRSVCEIVRVLREFAGNSGNHAFWPDDVHLTDVEMFSPELILGPKQITDLYLLALAVRHEGILVTFEKGIHLPAVRGAKPRHLFVIGD